MIHTRSELIDWIKKNVDDRVLLKALDCGTVECLGGFNPLPTSTNPGWIVRLQSPFGATYLIAVAWDTANFRLYWFRAPDVPWENWAGNQTENRLYRGDYPELYATYPKLWEDDDTRFARIERCTGVHPETDGYNRDRGEGTTLADGDVPSTGSGPETVYDERDRR